MKNSVVILLGSNLGNRHKQLKQAIELINELAGKTIKTSAMYETKSWGNVAQYPFLNQCIVIKTVLTPNQLLSVLKTIENHLGRKERAKWSNREIDIDILFYEHAIIFEKALVIPHPWFHKRPFAILPAKSIMPNFVHPIFKIPLSEL